MTKKDIGGEESPSMYYIVYGFFLINYFILHDILFGAMLFTIFVDDARGSHFLNDKMTVTKEMRL